MMITEELTEYRDETISFKYPVGLRKKAAGSAYYFVRPKPRNRPIIFETLFIEIDPPKSVVDYYHKQMSMPLVNWGKAIKQKIMASGKSPIIPKALEWAFMRDDRIRGVVEYRWDLLLRRDGHVLYVRISSTGDFEKSRPHWAEVIRSIQFVGKKSEKSGKTRRSTKL